MTREESFEQWLAEPERTEVVREVARKLPPWNTYRLQPTGQRAAIEAYAEDGTVRAFCWYDWMGPSLGYSVFGLNPVDLVAESSESPKYEHKGAGWCSQHGFWSGPQACPSCDDAGS